MKNRQIRFIAEAARWFDKVNGNTYHSSRITRVRDGQVITVFFQYGYGDMYRQTALKAMWDAGWFNNYKQSDSKKRYGVNDIYSIEREHNYPIYWNVTDGLKRDCVTNGTI